METLETARRSRIRNTVFGLLLVTGGLLLLVMGRTLFSFGMLWPLIFVGLGAAKMAAACCRRQFRNGVWFLALGLWFALNEFTALRARDTWPLLVVAVGGLITWRALAPAGPCATCGEGRHD